MAKLFSVWLIELVVNCYDYLTLPLYFIIQRPWKAREAALCVRAHQIEPFVWVNLDTKLDKSNKKKVETLDELFRESVANYASKSCLGIRRILAVEYKDLPTKSSEANQDEKKSVVERKKVVSKYVLDDKYTWFTYRQCEETVIKISAGLISMCNESLMNPDGSKKLLICADTCMQWFLTAHACFRNNVTVVTAYTTLTDEVIREIIVQTEVRIIVVSQKIARRLPSIIEEAPNVDTVIVLDKPLPGEIDELSNLKSSLLGTAAGIKRIVTIDDVQARGSEVKEQITDVPTGTDTAVLMYTSGSTGKAKGVILSHSGIVYTALSFSGPGDISHEDRYIGYLPLGHVLELAAECIFLRNGSTIAYSSPLTLTSNSPMIKHGQKGDAVVFKPTIMGAVPLVLDRIKNSVQSAVKSQGPFYDQLINDFVVRYKRYWWEKYYDTPIMNWLICKRFNLILGGEIRAICSGGAALTKDTQEYLRHVLNYTVLQGYGLTETSAAASFCNINDRRYNVVGPPYPIVRIKLESWSDYSIHDKPYPRGEIIIGGQPVSMGYYKDEELTKEAFYVDEKSGIRYFKTGDIGAMLPDGCLKIIDRKKDIVKPLSGEYISLSEIELALQISPLVENICVYCSQYSNYVVALVRPDEKALRSLAKQVLENANGLAKKLQLTLQVTKPDEINRVSLEILCANSILVEQVLTLLQEIGLKQKLKRTQIPSKIKLVSEEWSPESGLVTGSFKKKRRELERKYASDIKQLYAALGQTIEQ